MRYADDLLVGFQYQDDAERFKKELQDRLAKFGLELNGDKTRLIEFGRWAEHDRQQRGEGKPETFNFLGFTHYCGKHRKGYFALWRKTIRKTDGCQAGADQATAATTPSRVNSRSGQMDPADRHWL